MLPAATPPNVTHLLRRCLDEDPKRRLRDIGDAPVELNDQTSSPGEKVSIASRRIPIWGALAVGILLGAMAVLRSFALDLKWRGISRRETD